MDASTSSLVGAMKDLRAIGQPHARRMIVITSRSTALA
jgi:hypothetical protein